MENIVEYLKVHYHFVLIGFGLLVIIDSILIWNWLFEPSGKRKNSFICSVSIDKWEENGLRAINIFLLILLIICKVVILLLYKRY